MDHRPNPRRIRDGAGLASLVVALLATARPLDACAVPVFRYALERWPADAFRLWVIHESPLDDAAQALVTKLRESEAEDDPYAAFDAEPSGPASARPRANFGLEVAAADGELPEDVAAVWARERPQDVAPGSAPPRLVAMFPARSNAPEALAWSGELTAENVARLIDSPVRRQIAARLLGGSSAVWIFIPSGDEAQDAEARTELVSRLAEMQSTLALPVPDAADLELAGITADEHAKIRIEFPIVDLSRGDAAEGPLLAMLLGIEPQLVPPPGEALRPMAIPIFGRGRALYALIGAGINKDTIADACRFLVGPCSCLVKEENPGVDILIAANWDAGIEESAIPEKAPPPLIGLDVSAAIAADEESIETDPPTAQPSPPSTSIASGDLLATSAAEPHVAVAPSPSSATETPAATPSPAATQTSSRDERSIDFRSRLGGRIVFTLTLVVAAVGALALLLRR